MKKALGLALDFDVLYKKEKVDFDVLYWCYCKVQPVVSEFVKVVVHS
jgi:hypothetical protein